ncbi:hypothetical protein CBER1_10230 [Cercospora berteroae]|uniref:Uncharacterized protein n=1 Tax=Cercospora berteroae TaxID=357750 RepID=A0A2S6BXX6_9PEZI|nr:hypothetical protein CBER1_10230 [Cercospora berteroae]
MLLLYSPLPALNKREGYDSQGEDTGKEDVLVGTRSEQGHRTLHTRTKHNQQAINMAPRFNPNVGPNGGDLRRRGGAVHDAGVEGREVRRKAGAAQL